MIAEVEARNVDEEEFIRRLEVLSDFQLKTAIKENKKILSTAERRVKELQNES